MEEDITGGTLQYEKLKEYTMDKQYGRGTTMVLTVMVSYSANRQFHRVHSTVIIIQQFRIPTSTVCQKKSKSAIHSTNTDESLCQK